jgi:HAD superfamily hydrolase (TIGR01509 family)
MRLVDWLTRGRATSLLMALFGLLALTACHANVAVNTTVTPDGSGQVETIVTLDPQAAAGLLDLDLGLGSSGLPLNDLGQSGWLVDKPQLDTNGATVVRATKKFGTPDQFGEIMAELNGPDGVFRNFSLTRTTGFARVDYAVSGSIDTTGGFESFADPELEAALGHSLGDIATNYKATPADVTFSFDVSLPGEAQTYSASALVKAENDATQGGWQASLADGEVKPVAITSGTREVVPRVLRGVAVVAGVMAVLLVFARLMRILLPDRRRRRPPRRPVSDVRAPVTVPPTTGQMPIIPPGTDYRWVAVDASGVLFREADEVTNMLVPFARKYGSTSSEAEIESRLRWLRLGRITSAEFWAAIGVAGNPDQLDTAYLSGHQLSSGVIRYLRNLRERGVKLACLTDDAPSWASRLRMSHSLETLIQAWVVSGNVGVTKPDRSIFEVLRRTAGEPPPHIMVIDDDLDVLDVARDLGFATAWFTATGHRSEARDHLVIRTFEVLDSELVESDRTS